MCAGICWQWGKSASSVGLMSHPGGEKGEILQTLTVQAVTAHTVHHPESMVIQTPPTPQTLRSQLKFVAEMSTNGTPPVSPSCTLIWCRIRRHAVLCHCLWGFWTGTHSGPFLFQRHREHQALSSHQCKPTHDLNAVGREKILKGWRSHTLNCRKVDNLKGEASTSWYCPLVVGQSTGHKDPLRPVEVNQISPNSS